MGSPRLVIYADPPAWLGLPWPGEVGSIENAVLGSGFEIRCGTCPAGQVGRQLAVLGASLAGASALIVHRCQVSGHVLDAAGPALRVVGRLGTGADNLDIQALEQRGVAWFTVPGYCATELADHALALALAVERGLIPQFRLLCAEGFNPLAGGMPRRLSERQAGIVGYGNSGRALGRRLVPLYGRVAVFDPAPSSSPDDGVDLVTMPELLAGSDTVFLCCPLTPQTRGMVDHRFLRQMPPGAVLVNTARGGLLDARAVCQALESGRLGGAAFDVFEPEDPARNPWYKAMFALPNVAGTCHRGNLSAEAVGALRRVVADTVSSYLGNARNDAM